MIGWILSRFYQSSLAQVIRFRFNLNPKLRCLPLWLFTVTERVTFFSFPGKRPDVGLSVLWLPYRKI